jgi:DNA-binding NtrC family response regulator
MAATINLFAKDNATSSFIQDVLSSVDYAVDIFRDIPATDAIPQVPLVIWDLDSFSTHNLQMLKTLREKTPDTLILVYAELPERFGEISNKLYDSILSVESLKLHLMSQIAKLKDIHTARQIFRERMSHLVGKSRAMEQLRKTVERAIVHTGPVLIQGETGVGKELIARAVGCMYEKFVTVNCSAIPDNLFESELFGHTRGAFTGAQNERIGLFEAADGGAIFLDEIGDMPLHAQVKLLRVLQNKEIRPLGSNKTKHVDVRIIAATNRDLQQEIAEKRFREDLYYRLNVIPMQLSPLRDRKEDIEDLANYFIHTYQGTGEHYTLSSEALRKLQEYDWPGNIRELENVIQRALCFTSAGILQPEDLHIDTIRVTSAATAPQASSSLSESTSDHSENVSDYEKFRQTQLAQERDFLIAKIRECNGSVREAAQKLGLFRTALYNRLNHLGVNVKEI